LTPDRRVVAAGLDGLRTEKFLEATMPRLTEAETAIHIGDAGPRIAMWSRNEPVTLFGAAVTRTGWAEAHRRFEWVGSLFSDCTGYEIEVVAAGSSGDLAYRELFGYDEDRQPIGPEPVADHPDKPALWHEAWRALGPAGETDLRDRADGSL